MAQQSHPVSMMARAPVVRSLAHALTSGKRVVATGAAGSSTFHVAGALALLASRPIVLVTAHLDDGDEAALELEQADPALRVVRLPALPASPGLGASDGANVEAFAARLRALQAGATRSPDRPCVIVCPIAALMQLCPSPKQAEGMMLALRVGERHSPQALAQWLTLRGLRRVDAVDEPGQFSLRGGLVDVYPSAPATDESGSLIVGAGGEPVPLRVEFFGDEIERVCEIDPATLASDRSLSGARLYASAGEQQAGGVSFLDCLPREALVVLSETMEIVEQGRGYFERVPDGRGIVGPPAVLKVLESRFGGLVEINQFSAGASNADERVSLGITPLASFARETARALDDLRELASAQPVLVACHTEGDEQRLRELLGGEHAGITTTIAPVHRGYVLDSGESSLAVVPYHEIVGRSPPRKGLRGGVIRAGRAIDTFLDFQEGDYVVHVDHGIAKYLGLTLMRPREVPSAQRALLDRQQAAAQGKRSQQSPAGEEQQEYLVLEFASASRLYVPALQVDLVQKYVGGYAGKPPLSTLGGVRWKTQKERVYGDVKDLAAELLRVRAAREHVPGLSFPHDTTWQGEFEAQFPHDLTPDQAAALQEIKRDMHAPRPMDRLICGDVGFGKTELAIRAAFKAVESGRQVAVLVPTTVLCEQHERTFRARFAGFPFRVESISRFKTDAQVRETLRDLRKGSVDVIIGTHRLLSNDVAFADLGLVIIDEEQRFGVEHKEGLLRLRLTADILTLSATPIPRTLHMAMLGIRDISSLTTPPADRRAIVTEVLPYNQKRIAQALARELSREGQAFFVHNRVHDILSVADEVRRLAPEGARVVYGHGQMEAGELERVMLAFLRREADILVSTTIIESGIDIASANTIIINDADRFGLAELHQLRGRVGRSNERAYCYLLLPDDRPVKDTASKRLRAIEQFSMLGAGFKIAMRDLEIRGAGNILGPEQSGHIAAVGYEMYCKLLEQAAHDLRHDAPPTTPSVTSVEIGLVAIIPKAYIPSDQRRLGAYRRLALATSKDTLSQAVREILDAYGTPPTLAQRLFELVELRLALAERGVRSVSVREKDVIFHTSEPQRLHEDLARDAPKDATLAGTLTILSPAPLPTQGHGGSLRESEGLPMVYFRPPTNTLDPSTLLLVLRKRLGLLAMHTPSPALDPRQPSAAPPAQGHSTRKPPPRGVRSKPAKPS